MAGVWKALSSFRQGSEASLESSLEAEIATGVLNQRRESWEVEGVRYFYPHPSSEDWPGSQRQPLHHTDDWTSHTCSQLFFNSDIVIGDVFL